MYDLIVIGGGPGGYVGAIRAAQLGMSVLLVEKDSLGGTCLNRGCIPTKSFYNDSKLLKQAKQSAVLTGNQQLGIAVDAMVARKRALVKGLVGGIEGLLKANGIKLVHGIGRIKKSGVVSVEAQNGSASEYEAKNILLATGSRPQVLPFLQVDGRLVQTTDQTLDSETIPQRIAIIGGGVIGVEMAGIFANMGREVAIFEILPDLLMTEDADVRALTTKKALQMGIELHLGTKVVSVQPAENTVTMTYADQSGKEASLTVDCLLAATGRAPCLDGVEHLGLTMEGPFIKVDKSFKTSLAGVYAIGDVIGGMMLAHKASAEAEAAVELMAGHITTTPEMQIPSCIWGPVEIGSIGLTEEQAKAKDLKFTVGRFPFQFSGAAAAKGAQEGFVKIIGEKQSGEILGVHIAGEGATEMIGEAIALVGVEAVVEDFQHVVKPHPTLNETILEAALDWSGRALHAPPRKKYNG